MRRGVWTASALAILLTGCQRPAVVAVVEAPNPG
jgi:hypothetical protein